jgi:hypothetical protein
VSFFLVFLRVFETNLNAYLGFILPNTRRDDEKGPKHLTHRSFKYSPQQASFSCAPRPPTAISDAKAFSTTITLCSSERFSTSLLNRPGEQSIDVVGSKSHRQDHAPRMYSKNAVPILRTPQLSDSESSAETNSVEHFHTIPADRMPSASGYHEDLQREHRGKQRKHMPEPMTTPTQHSIPTRSGNLLSRHHYSPIAKELTTPNFAQIYSNQSTPTMC